MSPERSQTYKHVFAVQQLLMQQPSYAILKKFFIKPDIYLLRQTNEVNLWIMT